MRTENSSTAGRDLVALPRVHQLQPVGLQNALHLIARVHCPRSGGIKLHVRAPVLQRHARLFDLFVGQRQVVVGIGISWSKLQRGMVGLNGFGYAAGLVQHIAQIEIGKRIAGINLYGRTVMFFRHPVFLPVVVKGTEINMRRGMLRIEFQHLLIRRDRLYLIARILFECDTTRKKFAHIRRGRVGPRPPLPACW